MNYCEDPNFKSLTPVDEISVEPGTATYLRDRSLETSDEVVGQLYVNVSQVHTFKRR